VGHHPLDTTEKEKQLWVFEIEFAAKQVRACRDIRCGSTC
jgi:hypothetical protein